MSDELSPVLLENVGFLLAMGSAGAIREANRALAPVALKARSYTVLSLAAHNDGITQRELASQVMLDPSQIVALVDGLQDLGYVERRPDPADRRTRQVVATPKGRRAVTRARELVRAAHTEVLATLSTKEQDLLLSLLQRVVLGNREVLEKAS